MSKLSDKEYNRLTELLHENNIFALMLLIDNAELTYQLDNSWGNDIWIIKIYNDKAEVMYWDDNQYNLVFIGGYFMAWQILSMKIKE